MDCPVLDTGRDSSRQWTVDSGQWTGQLEAVDSGQWTGQLEAVDSGQWTGQSGQKYCPYSRILRVTLASF